MAKSAGKVLEKLIELRPDAWERFERAFDIAAKSPPYLKAKAKRPNTREKPNRARAVAPPDAREFEDGR